jgi:hypothetical protein
MVGLALLPARCGDYVENNRILFSSAIEEGAAQGYETGKGTHTDPLTKRAPL